MKFEPIPTVPNYEINWAGEVRRIGSKELNKFYENSRGYLQTTCNGKKYLLSHLLAETFLPNPHNRKCVFYKDGDKTNNTVWNLSWY